MNSDHKNIINRYNKRIEKYGDSIKSLASGKESRRKLRFKILSELDDMKNKSILDLGCGFGDLYEYLYNKYGENNFNYHGIDINPKIIEIAKKRNPKLNFSSVDLLNSDYNKTFDFILSSATFNNKLNEESNYTFIEKIFEKCYKLSEKGFAIDFMTDYVHFKSSDEIFYYKPEKVFSIAKKFSKKVSLRHDYELFDFCIYVYKDFDGWKI